MKDHRDQVNDDANENNVANIYRINNYKTTTSKSVECNKKIIESIPDGNNT